MSSCVNREANKSNSYSDVTTLLGGTSHWGGGIVRELPWAALCVCLQNRLKDSVSSGPSTEGRNPLTIKQWVKKGLNTVARSSPCEGLLTEDWGEMWGAGSGCYSHPLCASALHKMVILYSLVLGTPPRVGFRRERGNNFFLLLIFLKPT